MITVGQLDVGLRYVIISINVVCSHQGRKSMFKHGWGGGWVKIGVKCTFRLRDVSR